MKYYVTILFTFILGFMFGRLPISRICSNIFPQNLKYIEVIDGDTIYTLNGNKIEKIRLLDIDCHETSYNSRAEFQSKLYNLRLEEIYHKGKEEKLYLEKLINDNSKNIYIKRVQVDKYGRTLGYIYIGKKLNINKMLLENNICPPYVSKF